MADCNHSSHRIYISLGICEASRERRRQKTKKKQEMKPPIYQKSLCKARSRNQMNSWD